MKRIVSLLLAIMLMLSLVACSNNSNSNNNSSNNDSTADNQQDANEPNSNSNDDNNVAEPSKYDVTEPVTIEFWYNYGAANRQAFIEEIAAEFNASQDMVTVEPIYIGDYATIDTQIIAAQTAGTGYPALATMNYPKIVTYAKNEASEPLDEYIAATGLDIDEYVDGLVEPCRIDGVLYGMPFGAYSAGIFYNQDILDELNIPVPETWEDLKAMSKAVYEAKGIAGFAFSSSNNFINQVMVSTGGDPLDDINDPLIVEWVKDFKEQYDLGYMDYIVGSDSDNTCRAAFAGGVYAAAMDNTQAAEQVQDLCDFQMTVRLPINNGTTSGGCLIIPSINDQNTKNAAWQFAMFLTNEENALKEAMTLRVYPLRKSLIEDADTYQMLVDDCPLLENVYANLDKVISKNTTQYYTKGMGTIKTYFGMVVSDDADFDTAWSSLTAELEQIFSGN